MKKNRLIVALLAMLPCFVSHAGSTYARLYAKISSDSTGLGTVYAATNSTATSGSESAEIELDSGFSAIALLYAHARANEGYAFDAWTADAAGQNVVSTNNPYEVEIEFPTNPGQDTTNYIDRTVYARFKEVLPSFAITFETSTNGTYTVDGAAPANKTGLTEATTVVLASSDPNFLNWRVNGAVVHDNPYTARFTEDTTISADFLPVPYVEPVYVDGDVTAGIDHWVTNSVALSECTVVEDSSGRVTWTTGWYLVTNEVTLAGGATCSGAVKLILADGGHLTADVVNDQDPGIGVGAGSSLTIFAQPGGTGVLVATAGNGGAGIGGGNLNAGSNIAINGGSVTAMSANLGDGIGSGYSGATCTDIFVAARLSVFAGADDLSTSEIAHSGTDDLAATLSDQRYVKVVAPIAEGDVTLSASSFTYNGSTQKPTVKVTVDLMELEEGVDYTLTNAGGTNLGDYTVTVVGTGDYEGTVVKSFSITVKQITESDVSLSASSFAYNGSNQKPTVTVTVGGNALVSGTDYTLANAGGTDLGDYTVRVVGTGNYEGTVTKSFSIVKADASITTAPTVSAEIVKGAALSTISLVGGEASVPGTFAWASPETTVAEDGEFEVIFTPDDDANYNPTNCWVEVTVKQGKPECVQLWAGGPYWATCNVGASAPQKYGYYFWWGDTVGYKRNATNDGWVSADGQGTSIEFSYNDPTAATTWAKDNAWLQNNGYIDSTGNLVAAHDAATAKLGASWRMPTGQDFSDLLAKCTRNWTTNNGVNGWLVTGTGDFASKSIFLPVAGSGSGSDLASPENGYYWSSTPSSQRESWSEFFCSSLIDGSQTLRLTYTLRNAGFSVRAVRDTPPPTPIPVLPADSTATVVSNTVIEAGFSDATVQDLIAGDPATYNAFKTWAGTVAGGEAAAVASAHAAASFQLRGAVASPTLFENEPTLKITDLTEGVSGWYITVELKDGDTEIQLRAATDAFANKVRKGNAVDAINTLCTSADITAAVQEGQKKVKLTITPPAGGTGFFTIAFD